MKEYWVFAFLKDKIQETRLTDKDEANECWLGYHRNNVPTYTEASDNGNLTNGKFHDMPELKWMKVTNYNVLFNFLHNDMKERFGSDFLGSSLYYSKELNVFEFRTKRIIDDGLYEVVTTFVNAYDRDSFLKITKLC